MNEQPFVWAVEWSRTYQSRNAESAIRLLRSAQVPASCLPDNFCATRSRVGFRARVASELRNRAIRFAIGEGLV
jgi:hypothetical protein